MNKSQQIIKIADERGYEVMVDGKLRSPTGSYPKLRVSSGYLVHTISIRKFKNRNCHIFVHRLAAYQTFGDVVFNKEIQVRHLNGNCLDNRRDNLAIGTASENQMDKSLECRKRVAKIAAQKLRKFNETQIRDIRRKYAMYPDLSLKDLAKQYQVAKSTIYYILERQTYSDVV